MTKLQRVKKNVKFKTYFNEIQKKRRNLNYLFGTFTIQTYVALNA